MPVEADGEVERKLEIIIRLLAAIATRDLRQRDQIAVLARTGLPPRKIAELVGTSANTVRVELVRIRARKKIRPAAERDNESL